MSSISSYAFPGSDAVLRRQRRNATIASVVIALLSIVLVMLILALILLPSLIKEVPVLVSYTSAQEISREIPDKPVASRIGARPAAPSAAMSRMIAANTSSAMAVPAVDVEISDLSEAFGTGADFGDGWGGGGDGWGNGTGDGGTTFFSQKIQAVRVAYVIDYSGSLRGTREKLMREELAKSVSGLSSSAQFQMIFFAGPAWIAGSTVDMEPDNRSATITESGRDYRWRVGGSPARWEQTGSKQRPRWIDATPEALEKAKHTIHTTPLSHGTDWEIPLEMAIGMTPPPQVIFFMTDGAVSGDMVKLAEKLGRRAKSRDIRVNTVAMMQPDAEEAMKELARRSGGQFSIVKTGGVVEVVPVE